MILLIDEKKFEKACCKHCMINNEVGCRYKKEGVICPTVGEIKKSSELLADKEIITILASLGHCNAKGYGFEFKPIIEKFKKLKG